MAFPQFLDPAQSIRYFSILSAGGSDAIHGKSLNFSIEIQQQTNWCWAAVASSVSRHYDRTGATTQCDVANAALQRADCCGPVGGDRSICNIPWYLDAALKSTDNLEKMLSRTLSFSEIQSEIEKDAPIGTRVGWLGGGGHFQVIVGWIVGGSGSEYIEVSDPIYLDAQIAYLDFASAYQSGGVWTHAYLTRPAAFGGMVASTNSIYDQRTIGA